MSHSSVERAAQISVNPVQQVPTPGVPLLLGTGLIGLGLLRRRSRD